MCLKVPPSETGYPPCVSPPRRLFEHSSRSTPSLGLRTDTPYADLLREVLRAVNMSGLLVRDLPPPASVWALLPDEPQSRLGMALALDDHILQEMLEAFNHVHTS